MFLFINVYITDKPFAGNLPGIHFPAYTRGFLEKTNKLDVFKYSLASLSVLPITKAVIYCELDKNYINREKELETYCKELFGELSYYNWRNGKQIDWQKALSEILSDNRSELVWFLNNHDHIMIANETSIKLTTDFIKEFNECKGYVSLYYSHYPELVYDSLTRGGVLYKKKYITFDWDNVDSVQLMTKALLRSWWYEADYGNSFYGRSDFGLYQVKTPSYKCFIPLLEQVRHYDGYNHAGLGNDLCPAIEIPNGWNSKCLKIEFSESKKEKDSIWINPWNTKYKSEDKLGVDYKWTGECDIPLFWKKNKLQITFDEKAIEWNTDENKLKLLYDVANAKSRKECNKNMEKVIKKLIYNVYYILNKK